MKTLKMFEELQGPLYSLSDTIPIRKFLIFSELCLILILLTSLLYQEYFTSPVIWLMMIYISLLILLSLILLFTKHKFTLIAFIAGLFIIAGSSIVSFFLELFLATLNIHILEGMFLINAVVIVFVGFKLLKYQYDKIDRISLLFMWWSFSILYVAYVPFLELNSSGISIGYGLVTSIIFGGILSAVSSLLYLKYLSEVDRDEKRIYLNSGDYYETVNRLKRN
ncbi:MAG: hypothetical protein ACQEQM_00665 [Thermoplasmatota archaeon]